MFEFRKMWHEARRQERKIRGMLVDYRRRAERRRDFYERIKADPTQFLQVHGRQCKIHLDPNVAAAADSAVMMPWQGQSDNLIDRFDVRAHLDYVPSIKKEEETEMSQEERQLNYERYRIIAQNSFLGITEEKFLKQLYMEEQFGYTDMMKVKKDPRSSGAAIGFNYEDGSGVSNATFPENADLSDDNNSDSDLDVDLAINVSKMDPAQAHDMNKHGRNYGMSSNDFYSFLTHDLEEAESFRLAKEEEQEKALFSGRKSRRERRYHREKRLANRVISPPSYAAQASPTMPTLRDSKSKSHSRSPSPDNSGKITYITSFGDDEEAPSGSKPTYAEKVKFGKSKNKKEPTNERIIYFAKRRSRSRSRERSYTRRSRLSRSRTRRSRSRSKSKLKLRRSKSRSRNERSRSRRSRSRSRSRSISRRSRSRSKRSLSRSRYRRTRSRSRTRNSLNKRSTSRTSRSLSKSRRSKSGSNDRIRRSISKSRSQGQHFSRSPSVSSKSKYLPEQSLANKRNTPSPQKVQSQEEPKSRSPSAKPEAVPKTLPRYYGRKKSDDSSSELSDSDDQVDTEVKPANIPVSVESKSGHGNNSGTAIKKTTMTSMTVIERLKRKRQALLNRQFKADKIAQQLKTEREKQEQQTREDELREMAIRLRKRQREKRHAYDSNRSSFSSSDTDSSSKSKESNSDKNKSRDSSREREIKTTKRLEPRQNSKERRDGSGSRDGRGQSRDRRDKVRRETNRYNRRDKDNRDRRSPTPPRKVVYRERWRDDYEENDNRGGRSLVDY